MPRAKFIKGNIHRDDHLRALVTDTIPGEVPIIFSNDGFYLNEKKRSALSQDSQTLLEAILEPDFGKSPSYTIPYRYRVTKDAISTRRLSLIHPRSQVAVTRFYAKFEELICYYNSQNSFSIRAPTKVGSTYFYRSSIAENNKYKSQSVDTLQFEKRVRNPASYFSYRGHDRLYKFFDSVKFERLEKKFPVMWFGDVSKCFDSLYTHTLTWAVKDMPTSKTNTRAYSFGNSFDTLMQKMNYNETNGVCIGPELSRVFAETILQKIDRAVIDAGKKAGLIEKRDYECFRYVDDIILFAKSDEIANSVYELFEDSLGQYNLHLNDTKLEKFDRPFLTPKSKIINRVKAALSSFTDLISEQTSTPSGSVRAPKFIFRSDSVRRNFLREIKSICSDNNVGYDMVSNYAVASLSNLLENALDGYGSIDKADRKSLEHYQALSILILDVLFFLYTVNPTVNMSFRMSKAMVEAIRFTDKFNPERSNFLIELLSNWTLDLLRSMKRPKAHLTTRKIPVEVINIVLALSQSNSGSHISSEFLKKSMLNSEEVDYFSIISLLFFIRTNSRYSQLKEEIENRVGKYFEDRADVGNSAHDAHLFLDYIACPHISLDKRQKVIRSVCSKLPIKALGRQRRVNVIKELQEQHWFTNWKRIELLNMIKRKELSAVY